MRDIYDVDAEHLLIVTTDRLSAFDVVLPDPIPFKGEVLTQISLFWFAKTEDMVANHLSELTVEDVVADADERAQLAGRSMVVRKLKALPIEAVVRGYLIGSGYKDYKLHGSVCGIPLPGGFAHGGPVARALVYPGLQGSGRTARREHRFRSHGEIDRTRTRGRNTAHFAAALRVCGGARACTGYHHRRYEIRVRYRSGGTPPC